jgi:2'-5' RNA ligase
VRLFLAADLEAKTARAAGECCGALEEALVTAGAAREGDVKWVTAEAMHVTIHFLGEVSDDGVAALREILAAPLVTPSFMLGFGAIGCFPAVGRPHVVWLSMTSGAESLVRIHGELAERLRALDAAPSAETERPYQAHLTLARFRRGAGARTRSVLAAVPLPELPPSRIDRVTLYESRLSSEGAKHVALLSLPLPEITART